MSEKQVRVQYMQAYKQKAVRQVKAGQSIAVAAKVLGVLGVVLFSLSKVTVGDRALA